MTLCNLNLLACWTALASVHSAFGGIINGYVYPRIIESRSDDGHMELMINDNINLNLEMASPFADTFRVIYENEGANFVEERKADSLSGEIYKDTKQQAALLISRENGLRVRGVIQGNLMIDHDDEAVFKNGLVRHRLSTRKSTAIREYHDDVTGSETFHESFGERNKARLNERSLHNSGSKRATVETTVVLGHKYFSQFKKSNHSQVVSVIDYMAVFVALVNAVFEEFDKSVLNIQLSVVSVVLLKSNSQTFLQTIPQNGDAINGSTLQSFNKFVEKHEAVLGKQDIVVFISNYTISTGDVYHSPTHYVAGFQEGSVSAVYT
uniref:Putative tick metalloprotease n=1 Tax=Amblyomma americanum TaxID=6943 RepID=A0A0C9R6U5_AMBAM